MDIDKFGTFRQSPEHLLPFILSTKFLCWRLIWSNSIYVAFEVTQFTSNDTNGIIRNGQLIKWMLIKHLLLNTTYHKCYGTPIIYSNVHRDSF